MTTHLVIGAGGQIGSALTTALRAAGADVITTTRQAARTSHTLDLAAVPTGWKPPRPPDIVYVCAAITNLAACESDPIRAHAVNVDGPLRMSQELVDSGAAFCVFLSSNAVFDGRRPYSTWSDTVSPVNVYGRLKAEAEARLCDIWKGRLAVLRLTKVFHAKLPLVAHWTTELLKERPISAFDDMLFAPISMQATVDAVLKLAHARTGGIFHLSGARDVSYLTAARVLAGALGAAEMLVTPSSWREVPGLVEPPSTTALGMGSREQSVSLLPQPLSDVVGALAPCAGAVADRK
jgi:dTDP-4-dehydrorhamnose reductase